MTEERAILPREDIDVLFANAKTILAVNAELLRLLEQSLFEAGDDGTQPLSKAIATSFEKLMPFFRTYTEVRLRCSLFLVAVCPAGQEDVFSRARAVPASGKPTVLVHV